MRNPITLVVYLLICLIVEPADVWAQEKETATVEDHFRNYEYRYQARDYKGAVAELDKALALDHDGFPELFNNRGLAHLKLNHPQEALADFDQAIELQPHYPLAHFNRGLALEKLGEPREAIRAYTEAIRQQPNYSEAYLNRGLIKYEIQGKEAAHEFGTREGALDDYGKAIEQAPNDAAGYWNRALLLAELEDFAAAIPDFDKIVELQPRNSKAWYSRGQVHYNLGEYQSAINDYTQAIRFRSRYKDAWFSRGKSKLRLELPSACEDLTKAVELGYKINPNDEMVRYYLEEECQ